MGIETLTEMIVKISEILGREIDLVIFPVVRSNLANKVRCEFGLESNENRSM
jgi:predicted nucleotidyltransferase